MSDQLPPRPAVPSSWPPPAPSSRPAPVAQRRPDLPSYPHPEPVPYHLMLRTWNYTWWKPLVGLGLLLVLFLAVQVLVAGALVFLAYARSGPFMDNLDQLSTLESISPSFLLLLNISLGAMILVTWVTMRVVHQMRPRWLASVAPKFRWRFFVVCLGISVVALVAQVVVSQVLPGQQETDLSTNLNDFTTGAVALAVVVLLTTPFQAAGEEYFFRGYLMQAIGSLLGFSAERWVQVMARWTALLVTSSLFAVAHGAQNFPLFFDRFFFGLIAGWLVLRTGGLEAGVALHILNNFLAFGVALLLGDITESLSVSEISWWNIPLTLTQSLTYAALVVLATRRMGLRNQTAEHGTVPRQPVGHRPLPVA